MKAIMQLEDFTINEFSFKNNEDLPCGTGDASAGCPEDVYDFECSFFRHEDGPEFLVSLIIKCNESGSEPSRHQYSYKLNIMGIFSFEQGTPEETVQNMVGLNCPAILYGIARGVVSQITASMPCGRRIMPTVNFHEYFRKRNEDLKKIKPSATKKKSKSSNKK